MEIDSLEIQVGQRYSVLIETLPNPPKTDYYWRLRTMWRPTRVNGSALWRYDESAESSAYQQDGPVSLDPTPVDLNQTVLLANETFGWVSDNIRPWNKSDYPPSQAEVTRTIVLNGQQLVDAKGFRWSVNNELNNSTMPMVPYLVQFYQEDPSQRNPNYSTALQNGGYDPGSNTYPAEIGEVLDIVIENRAGPTSGMVEVSLFCRC